ncbi:MAG: 2-C-methyl-D-erythritol 2,4-cyclodiphosphate synthase [Caldisericia bacterium]|nr:2-C-methyl-D-erythritol 2,4-cyclodiphosphate synthase [Caldisericia bacterium]
MPSLEHHFSVVIVAGGLGTRFSSVENKTTKLLYGLPVLEYSLQAFQSCPYVTDIILVGEAKVITKELSTRYSKLTGVRAGGKTRTESVWNGLQAIDSSAQYVFIHDAARPLLEVSFINRMAEQILLQNHLTGLFPVLPLYDALKNLDRDYFPVTYEGQPLYRTQTPQLFQWSALKSAFMENVSLQPFRDEIQMIQHFRKESQFLAIPGSYHLEKITTLQEWHLIEKLVPTESCIGIGYDFHYFLTGRDLVLGGITIPGYEGLEGDSDGDVYIHSVLEALLGALTLGDMGSFFGVGTPEVMNKKSTTFLQQLCENEHFKNVHIKHIDTTIVCKKPVLKSWIPAMKKNISQHLSISENQINIKSTTDKGMDAAGEGKGIRCITVVLLDIIRRSYAG